MADVPPKRPILRLASSQPTSVKADSTIVIGKVGPIYRVSVLFKSHEAGEKLGADFPAHAAALHHAQQLGSRKGWTVLDITHEQPDF